jgi:DNA polymerase III subunit gamma/tau
MYPGDQVERLALKYRPTTFDKIVGQEYPKRVLQQLILNNRACANLLLHGSVGSGKTSLVRLYARAMNCEAPTAKGDSCGECGRCKSMSAGNDSGFVELDAPKFRNHSAFRDEMVRLLRDVVPTGCRLIIFVDEAHVVSKYNDSWDFLLKRVEEAPDGVSFCFATTAVDRISDALRSRTIDLEIRPLTHEQSIGLLGRTAKSEGLTFSLEALSLLAGLGEHQPRNMLQALDKMGLISDGTEITRARVAEVFGVDYIEHLIQYFEALGAGDFAAQTIRFWRWPDTVRSKAKLIQLFIVGFYCVELCELDVSVEPVIASIRRDERLRVRDAFARRLPGIDIKVFFEDLLNVWPVVTSDMSDEALLATLMRFQAVANRSEVTPRVGVSVERITPQAVVQEAPDSGERPGRRIKGDDADALKDPAYLYRSHVRSIFAASSFLVQAGHRPFNAMITIRHRLFGKEQQDEASDQCGRFSQALKESLKRGGGSGLRILVQERDAEEGSCGRVIAYVPDAEETIKWLRKWHRSSRVIGKEDEAISMEMVPAGGNLEGHWRCVRWLCGGFNPNDPVSSKLNIEAEYRRVAGDIGKRNRLDHSEPLGVPARRRAAEACGVQIISAFNDEEWGRLYDGWELDEHRYRKEQGIRWQDALAAVKAKHPLDGSDSANEVQEYEVQELRRRWLEVPQNRSWPIWSVS